MAANLATLTRSIDLSGLSGNAVALDPIAAPMEGAALSTISYSGGVMTVNGGASQAIVLLRCIPLYAYFTPSSGPYQEAANSLEVTWEQDTSDIALYRGGLFLYRYANGLFGTPVDGNGYFANLTDSDAGGAYDLLCYRRAYSGSLTFTQEGSTVQSVAVQPDWTRFRGTLSGTNTTKNLKVEMWTGSSYSTLFDQSVTSVGNQFGVGFRSQPNFSLRLRNISVAWKGPKTVVVPIGQSELSGYADTAQTNAVEDLIALNRSTGLAAVLSDPWEIAPQSAGANGWSGILAEPTSGTQNSGYPLGSAIPDWIAAMGADARPIAVHSAWVRGGSGVGALVPGSSAWDVSTIAGCGEMSTHFLAGDGRNTGQTLQFNIYHTTGNMGGSGWTGVANKAAYKAELQKLYTRIAALWPDSLVYQAEIGDRTWRYAGQAAMNQELREAHQEVWAANPNGRQWFDEATLTGEVGSGQGWAGLDADTYHPGVEDNVRLSQLMAGTYSPTDPTDGRLGFVPMIARMSGRGR